MVCCVTVPESEFAWHEAAQNVMLYASLCPHVHILNPDYWNRIAQVIMLLIIIADICSCVS